ncbi:MAG: FHA domain-containing protein [Candidatus Thermoplasmatota archaeon]|nr:FHA domain-containing protein [Candidatus Thermoplasmatota archaeon]
MDDEQFYVKDNNFFRMIKNNISPIDLFIISQLNSGKTQEELPDLIKKEFNVKDSEKIINQRIKKLLSDDKPEKKIIQYPQPKLVINPEKLYDEIFLVLIKANLDSQGMKNVDISIREIYDTILNINNQPRFGKPLKQFYTTIGWIYDFFGLVFENNINRFHLFRDHLLKENIIKVMDVIQLDKENGFLFNPIFQPNPYEYQQFLIQYKHRMNDMTEELKGNDLTSTQTIDYFSNDVYILEAIEGNSKGEIYYLDEPEIKIGRYYDNNIIIKDPTVSRRHAKINKIDETYILKDESTNGSHVNKELVHYDEKKLNEGDIIIIGKTKYIFRKLSRKNKEHK